MSKKDSEEQRLVDEPTEPAEEFNESSDQPVLKASETADPDQATAPEEPLNEHAPEDSEVAVPEQEAAAEEPLNEHTPEDSEVAVPEQEAAAEEPADEPASEEPEAAAPEQETAPEEPADEPALEEPEGAAQEQETAPEEPADEPASEEPEAAAPEGSAVSEESAEATVDEDLGTEEPVESPVADEPSEEPLTSESEALDVDSALIPIEEEGGTAWFVIHCYSGYENKVRHNLEQRIETMGMKDMIFDVVVPTQEEIEVRDGKRRTVERHIFPGYVLVNMILTEESWYVVRNTPGVTGFVGMGNNPTPLRPEEVSQIVKRMEADAPTVKVTFKVGERVRIVDGPFNDFRGMVAEIDMERTKVRVMVSFFGRETPVELDFLQVEKA